MKQIIALFAVLLISSNIYAQNEDVKGFQWGVSYRLEGYVGSFEHSAYASFGYRVDNQNYLGIQTGFIVGRPVGDLYYGIPLHGDYMHYYAIGEAKKHSLFTGVEVGGHFIRSTYSESYPANSVDFYASLKAGLDFNMANLTHLQVGLLVGYVHLGISVGFTF